MVLNEILKEIRSASGAAVAASEAANNAAAAAQQATSLVATLHSTAVADMLSKLAAIEALLEKIHLDGHHGPAH